jgi:Raf kinase inhibitor-like YbhB/YbcL family protein
MLEKMPAAVGRALHSVRPGVHGLVFHDASVTGTNHAIEVGSAAFQNGEPIPARFTEDGEKLSPPVAWRGVPESTAAVMLLIEDADSPTLHPFVHAIAWNLPPRDAHLPVGALRGPTAPGDGHPLGKNSMLKPMYLPPDPPPGHGPHRYAFQIYALDRSYDFARPPGRRRIIAALRGHVLAKGFMIGTYERHAPAGPSAQ